MTSDGEQIVVDLKWRLRQYLPILFEFLDVHDFSQEQWKKLNDNFLKQYHRRQRDYAAAGNYLEVIPNIYDLISAELKGNESATVFMTFLRKVLEELADYLSDREKKLIIKNLFDLMISYDQRFLNFLGELLVLNSIVKTRLYTLVEVESRIVNEKSADFLFKRKDNLALHLVEVRSFHVSEKNTRLQELFTKKLNEKIAEKVDNELEYNSFLLVPMIWAPIDDLRRVKDVYNDGKTFQIKNVAEPVSYISGKYQNGTITYMFGTLSTLQF